MEWHLGAELLLPSAVCCRHTAVRQDSVQEAWEGRLFPVPRLCEGRLVAE